MQRLSVCSERPQRDLDKGVVDCNCLMVLSVAGAEVRKNQSEGHLQWASRSYM